MTTIPQIKDELISELWIPIAKDGGDKLKPRLKSNKSMRTLTLTSMANCRELEEFIRNKLTKKEYIVGWNKGSTETIRLACEKVESVNPGCLGYVYEDAIQNPTNFQDIFPFDILNLDFSSQEPELISGRIEKEIIGLEHTLKIQNNKGSNGMALIYTTILNSESLTPSNVKQSSDDIRVDGGGELSIEGLPTNITQKTEKIEYLKKILEQISSKHHYSNDGTIKLCCKSLSNGTTEVLSLGVILKRC